MTTWLTQTVAGKAAATFLISMAPIVELRGGLPYGIALGLDYPLALAMAVIGNMVPVPFIIVYIRKVFAWIRRHMKRLDDFITNIEQKAHLKGAKMRKYELIGLWLFVALPLPGTGAWTGSLAAAFLDIRLKKAMPAVILGVLTAGTIMLTLTHVGINLFSGAI